DVLRDLNEGNSGLSQIGKALTVYCGSTLGPASLIAALDTATIGLEAPRIRFEPCYRGRGNLHARYGGFQGRRVRLPIGAIEPAIIDPDGRFLPDDRRHRADDPELKDAGFQERDGPPPLIDGRYALVQRIFETPRGDVLSAIDVQALRKCIAKVAFAGDGRAPDGSDAVQRLVREATALDAAAPTGLCPTVLAQGIFQGGRVLIIDYIDGEDLVAWMQARPYTASLAEQRHRLALFDKLCGRLDALEAVEVRPLDLSAQNVRVTPEEEIRLIDLEHVELKGRPLAVPARGTPGYAMPDGVSGDPGVYALSAILYMLLTGLEPSRHPAPTALERIPINELNPAVPSNLSTVVSAGLSGRILDRETLRRAVGDAAKSPGGPWERPRPTALPDPLTAIDDALCRWIDAQVPEDQAGQDRCVYSGLAGVAAYALAAEYDTDRLASLARCLAVPEMPSLAHPGFLVGDGGRALVLFGLARHLEDAFWADTAVALAMKVLAQRPPSPDLMNGRAGLLCLATQMQRFTGISDFGTHAVSIARDLAENPDWSIPEGYGDLVGAEWRGAAHGEAGILLALNNWQTVSQDRLAAALVSARLRSLASAMTAPSPGRRKTGWPRTTDPTGFGGYTWCHGSVGISRTLFAARRAGEHVPDGVFNRVIRGLEAGASGFGPCLCHGHAGTIDVLVDFQQISEIAEPARHATARMERLLKRYVDCTGPDAMADTSLYTGLAGIAWSLSRANQRLRFSSHDLVAWPV
nr:lanthionine synthetase LanC family protein [Paracoccaceae bacterium]